MSIAMPVSQVPAPPKTFLEGLRCCRNPLLVMNHFREVRNRRAFIAQITGTSEVGVQQVLDEIEADSEFHAQLFERRQHFTGKRPTPLVFMLLRNEWGSEFFPFIILYGMVRILKPEVVVETGGTPGNSSAFMLRAMDRNRRGTLVTLDLPDQRMIQNFETAAEKRWYDNTSVYETPGWIVPESLRSRHEQVLGDARQTLPEVLKRYPEIDVFIHDSDHSYEHMSWEFRTAWSHVKPGGLLVSDDIGLNTSFYDFAREIKQRFVEYASYHIGAIKKPLAAEPAVSPDLSS